MPTVNARSSMTATTFQQGQHKWQNDRTGRIGWQRADLHVTDIMAMTAVRQVVALARA
jgi:hypothetical protein